MEIQQEARRIAKVWGALIVLLALTLGSAYLHLGAWNSIANLAIAAAKAALVATIFMHLRRSMAVVRVAIAIAMFTLALLFAVSSTDFMTRTIYRAPLQAPISSGS